MQAAFYGTIHSLNLYLGMASVSANIAPPPAANNVRGLNSFRIRGSVYYYISGVNPRNQELKFEAGFIDDPQNEMNNCPSMFSNTNVQSLSLL